VACVQDDCPEKELAAFILQEDEEMAKLQGCLIGTRVCERLLPLSVLSAPTPAFLQAEYADCL